MAEQTPTVDLGEQPEPFKTETFKANVTSHGNGEFTITLVYEGRDLVETARFRGMEALFSEAHAAIEKRKQIKVDETEIKTGESVFAVLNPK